MLTLSSQNHDRNRGIDLGDGLPHVGRDHLRRHVLRRPEMEGLSFNCYPRFKVQSLQTTFS